MADLAPEPFDGLAARFAKTAERAGPHSVDCALRGIEDIETLLEIGSSALQALVARGQDPSVPALALWREFYHAREALLALVEPTAA
ncbi:MAG: hypothetical protein AAGI28_17350 [Pseudomonadota bacterium]